MNEALHREIGMQNQYLNGWTVDSIYFGGGTPSLLDPRQIQSFLDTIYDDYTISSDAEITLEANPDDLENKRLDGLRGAGVNRLSIGIQSFHNKALELMNRVHTADQAETCIKESRKSGFDNLNLDVIYAIPGNTHEDLEADLERFLYHSPEHISAYCMTIEDRTAFGKWAETGKLKPHDDEFAADEFEMVMDKLQDSGYVHYEISNFCKPGFRSRHNSSYWKGEPYLGIGPSAHSFKDRQRKFNVSNNIKYINEIRENRIPEEVEELTQDEMINDYILTSIRTMEGCDLRKLQSEFGHDLLKARTRELKTLESNNLIILSDQFLVLTRTGKLLADSITRELMN